jgi:hypothetical protein
MEKTFGLHSPMAKKNAKNSKKIGVQSIWNYPKL